MLALYSSKEAIEAIINSPVGGTSGASVASWAANPNSSGVPSTVGASTAASNNSIQFPENDPNVVNWEASGATLPADTVAGRNGLFGEDGGGKKPANVARVPANGVPAPTAPPNAIQPTQQQPENNPPIVHGVALDATPSAGTASGAAAAPPASGTASAASAADAPAPALAESEFQVGDKGHYMDDGDNTFYDVTIIGIVDGERFMVETDDGRTGCVDRGTVLTKEEYESL